MRVVELRDRKPELRDGQQVGAVFGHGVGGAGRGQRDVRGADVEVDDVAGQGGGHHANRLGALREIAPGIGGEVGPINHAR